MLEKLKSPNVQTSRRQNDQILHQGAECLQRPHMWYPPARRPAPAFPRHDSDGNPPIGGPRN